MLNKQFTIAFTVILFTYPIIGYNATIREIQQILSDLGYNPGTIDGRWGSQSRHALKKFQADNGLPSNGRRNKATIEALMQNVQSNQNSPPDVAADENPKNPPETKPQPPPNAAAITPPKEKVIKTISTPDGIEFVEVPGGCFTMGNAETAALTPVHEVCVHKDSSFLVGKYEVTQNQWRAIIRNNPASHKGNTNYPVENVSWLEVQEFISKLNAKRRGTYRLLTEAEWEYSARAGTTTAYSWGNKLPTCINKQPNSANVNAGENCEHNTVAVGSYQANPFGIYDMHGNVWEWVTDTYLDDAYTKHKKNDPVINDNGENKVLRGGSWLYPGTAATSYRRDYSPQNIGNSHLGFRLVYEK